MAIKEKRFYVYLHRRKDDGTVPTVVMVRLSSKVLNGNKPINKQFTESHYGSLENTMTAARNFRDNILKEYHGNNTTTTCA